MAMMRDGDSGFWLAYHCSTFIKPDHRSAQAAEDAGQRDGTHQREPLLGRPNDIGDPRRQREQGDQQAEFCEEPLWPNMLNSSMCEQPPL